METTLQPQIIGGFFGLEPPSASSALSLASLWQLDRLPHLAFANGRSALHHALAHRKPENIWLPAYCCHSLVEACRGVAPVHFYPLLPTLSPDVDYLMHNVADGDALLAIDYFGRNPAPEFLAMVEACPGIIWVEDRAQAMLPARRSWGDYVLYTPRKLLGVPDGGIITAPSGTLPVLEQPAHANDDYLKPSRTRAQDKDETQNTTWYALNQEYENNMRVAKTRMSDESLAILNTTDANALMDARRANYKLLADALGDIALLPPEESFVPFGFPVCLPDRAKIANALYAQRIFAPRHWPDLPSPESFTFEHKLASESLTLPVDHRYGRQHMQRIIDTVRSAL